MSDTTPSDYESFSDYQNARASDIAQELVFKLVEDAHSSDDKLVAAHFAKTLSSVHRTSQASIVRLLLQSLVEYAKQADIHQNYDGRNEAAVKTLLKIAPIVNDNPIPFI